MGRGADWRAVRDHLPRDWTVDAPDLPAHGDLRDLPAGAVTMDAAASRLADALDAPADVVGYSMGGRLALHLAVMRPESVRRLVLVSASPGLRTEQERADRRALDAARAAEIASGYASFLDRWYRMLLFASLSESARRDLVGDRLRHNDPLALGRSLVGMGTGAQPSHWGTLAGISTPVLAVAGALDKKYVGLAREMAETGRVEVAVVPDAGHALLTEAPRALADSLSRFLS